MPKSQVSKAPPFERSYSLSLLTAVLSLVPYIVVTSAYVFYRDQVKAELGSASPSLQIINGLSTAAYAFGALAAGDIINRVKQRTLFLLFETLFVIGCALSATAQTTIQYGAGRILQGLATGLLLVVALPPVIQRFPASRMPITAAAVNIGFFGAVTLGPLVGGITAHLHAWRGFYTVLALMGCVTFGLAVLTLPHQEPPNRQMRIDLAGLLLGFAGTALPFLAVGQLSATGFSSARFSVPLGMGLACLLMLLIVEYRRKEPLAPVKQMWHTFPIVGTLAAMFGGAVYVAFLALGEELLLRVQHWTALEAGLEFWPQVVGVAVSAAMLGVLLQTRFLPILILLGMLMLPAGGWLLFSSHPPSGPHVLAAVGILGLGAGATVSPGLYLAAFSLPSRILGRIFALVELVRSVADFIVAPVMLELAKVMSNAGSPSAKGLHAAFLTTAAISLVSTLGGALLYGLGGSGLPRPDLAAWIAKNRPAWASPPLLGAVRRRN